MRADAFKTWAEDEPALGEAEVSDDGKVIYTAGDVWNLGLGAVIALRWVGPDGPAMRLVVLADSGGAFHGNLGQLDLYGGAFPTASALYAATAAVPQRVQGGVVVRRR